MRAETFRSIDARRRPADKAAPRGTRGLAREKLDVLTSPRAARWRGARCGSRSCVTRREALEESWANPARHRHARASLYSRTAARSKARLHERVRACTSPCCTCSGAVHAGPRPQAQLPIESIPSATLGSQHANARPATSPVSRTSGSCTRPSCRNAGTSEIGVALLVRRAGGAEGAQGRPVRGSAARHRGLLGGQEAEPGAAADVAAGRRSSRPPYRTPRRRGGTPFVHVLPAPHAAPLPQALHSGGASIGDRGVAGVVAARKSAVGAVARRGRAAGGRCARGARRGPARGGARVRRRTPAHRCEPLAQPHVPPVHASPLPAAPHAVPFCAFVFWSMQCAVPSVVQLTSP